MIEPAVAHQRHFKALQRVIARFLPAILVGTFLVPLITLTLPQLLEESHAGQITTSGLCHLLRTCHLTRLEPLSRCAGEGDT